MCCCVPPTPPHAQVTGYMFDKGVYFANCVTKSAQYCFAEAETAKAVPQGIMLLCEVALGDSMEMLHSDYYANKHSKRAGKHSVWARGAATTDPKGAVTLDSGVVVPKGRMCKSPYKRGVEGGTSLLYDEFIVYDIAQIVMRYAMVVNFHPREDSDSD